MNLFILLTDITALMVLAVLTVRLWHNLRFLHWAAGQTQLPEQFPRVSVLVPARNESANITDCVESLLNQEYWNYEIIVLDDQSTDDTGAKLDRLAAIHPPIRVIHGESAPPVGWNGKSYACHRLAELATGEWLLFTDADTLHTPHSITHGIARAQTLDVDLLSAFPRQYTGSWVERVMVPFILGFLPLVGLDFKKLWQGTAGQVAANGQWLLVRSETYRAVGGHAAVFNALVDDFALAQHFHHNGYRVALVDGQDMLACRMYRNAREVWNGFSKNILLGLTTASAQRCSWRQAVLFAWGYASLFVMPYPLLSHAGAEVALLIIAWLWLLRAIVAWYRRRSVLEALTTFIAALGVMALSLNSLYLRWRKKGVVWKARVYAAAPSSTLPDVAPGLLPYGHEPSSERL